MKDKLLAKIGDYWEKGYLYIFLAGLVYLIFLFSPRVGIYDWQKEIFYFDYIKTALADFHTWPYFVWQIPANISWYPALAQTHHFAGNPEVILFSPFLPLVYFVSALTYLKLLVFFHFIIGTAGCVALKKRLSWNNPQFRVFLALFLFSPIVIQHLAIGYSSYLNLFYFPWLIYFLLGRGTFAKISGSGAVLSLTLLQGGNHIFVWFAMFMVLYLLALPFSRKLFSGISRSDLLKDLPKAIFTVIAIVIVTGLLSFVRLFATVQSFGSFSQGFLAGYRAWDFVFWSLVPPALIFPLDRLFTAKIFWGVPSWDAGIFFGLAVVMAVVLLKNFKRWLWAATPSRPDHRGALLSVLTVSLLLGLLSFFNLFESAINLVNSLVRLPFINGAEKYPFRLMVPAFFGLSVVLAHYAPEIWRVFSDWFQRKLFFALAAAFKWLCLAGSLVLFAAFIISFWPSKIAILNNLLQTPAYRAYFFQYQMAAAILAVFLLAGYFLMKYLPRLRMIDRFFGYELLLAVPLLFASCSWLAVAVSRQPLVYDTTVMLNPPLAGQGPSLIKATPKEIIFQAGRNPSSGRYDFPGISAKDSNVLQPINADSSLSANQKDELAAVNGNPQGSPEFGLAYKTRPFYLAFYVTLAAWLALISGTATCLFIQKRRNRKMSDGHLLA